MREIDISADQLFKKLFAHAEGGKLCILDSCGAGHLGSHLLIAGINPVKTLAINNDNAATTLWIFEEHLSRGRAGIFTLSYDFGRKLEKIGGAKKPSAEPDIYLALFDSLVIHDYTSGKTHVAGNFATSDNRKEEVLSDSANRRRAGRVKSNFTRDEYLAAIESVKENIRRGDTYQTNLTQQLTVQTPGDLTPFEIFRRLRDSHPAPFAAYIERGDSTVVSASPERFFKVASDGRITTSPIKGTRRRGQTPGEDELLRQELLNSAKDRAENVMIVDLLRNDIGRVCEFGSVRIEKLCDLEEHPTLFHLVSTVSGKLRENTSITDIIRAIFPCGSITGAPKISTMQIIEEIETVSRGLSMGAIGVYVPPEWETGLGPIDVSVAIRTMVVRENEAVFNVGGGIVIDSDPEKEYDESLLKAKALLNALGAELFLAGGV